MTYRAWAGLLLLGVLAGCGRPGFPSVPDDYGIGLRMQQERQKEEQAKKEQAGEGIVTPPDEVILPDMRPVGGR